MYNFKDKAVHVTALLRERFADTDKEILRAVSPDHPEALSLRPSSTRHEIILHALLDIITREEIERKREEILDPLPSQEGKNGPTELDDDNAEGKDAANKGLKEQVKDIADQTDDIQTRVEDLESQVSGLSDDLNEGKKNKKRPVKPKRKPSTP